VLLALALPAPAAAGSASLAAVQAVLRAHGAYAGDVDGVRGPATLAALRSFQRRHGLVADGVVGARTRRALGRVGRHSYGTRALSAGDVGFDVAMLQFKLESHGFPCARVDGGYGQHVVAAVARFQRWAGLSADGVAGRRTLLALRAPPPRSPVGFARPVAAPIGDRFGPRGAGFHPGLDFPAATGTPVVAARAGRVVRAGFSADGYGNQVVLAHGGGVRTRYAHLSSIAVSRGQWVPLGARVGRVGATGFATGPHLHFEVLVRGAAVAPPF
jgi:peptidoglycan hydrolase-like protein with peptidoglycan-binding domain